MIPTKTISITITHNILNHLHYPPCLSTRHVIVSKIIVLNPLFKLWNAISLQELNGNICSDPNDSWNLTQ